MTRTQAEIDADCKLLDEVCGGQVDHAIAWLRSSFLTSQNAIAHLRSKLAELRELYLKLTDVGRPLTVREAQLCGVCRYCRGPSTPNGKWAFIMAYGEEFAHESCIKERIGMK